MQFCTPDVYMQSRVPCSCWNICVQLAWMPHSYWDRDELLHHWHDLLLPTVKCRRKLINLCKYSDGHKAFQAHGICKICFIYCSFYLWRFSTVYFIVVMFGQICDQSFLPKIIVTWLFWQILSNSGQTKLHQNKTCSPLKLPYTSLVYMH